MYVAVCDCVEVCAEVHESAHAHVPVCAGVHGCVCTQVLGFMCVPACEAACMCVFWCAQM